jgi:hypothetical protein
MKYSSILILLFVFACSDSSQPNENEQVQTPEPTVDAEIDEINESMDQFSALMDELQADSDSVADSKKKAFQPFDGVSRKTNNAPLNFNTYSYNDQFNYTFPQTPGFEKYEKDDHDSYAARTLVEGIIYEIAVEDYEKLGADKIDAGFTKYIHEQYISSFSDDIKESYELTTDAGVYGFATCYQYEMSERVYFTDLVTFGFQDKMVRFSVTAKVNFENAVRVKEFVDGFEIL